jgi:hypothetical protein
LHSTLDPLNTIDQELATSNELLGKECISCFRAFRFDSGQFNKDASVRDGFALQCNNCKSQPCLSMEEHVFRLEEKNTNSEAVKKQRWEEQEEYKNEEARRGKPMHHSELIGKLKLLIPELYVCKGNVGTDLIFYKLFDRPQPELGGANFRYLFYCPTGILPEYSLYEFDEKRDILIREIVRGWRSVLLGLIKQDMISERIAHLAFGEPVGEGSYIYRRELYRHRNRKNLIEPQ